jgi:hypothetical protein
VGQEEREKYRGRLRGDKAGRASERGGRRDGNGEK